MTPESFLQSLHQRVLIGDGAMGTQLQTFDLSEDDFRGLEGCNEILNVSRPDVVEAIHRAYLDAGADLVETNTFGCNLPNLGEYGIADRCRELAREGARIARRAADAAPGPRFVLGSLGPGTKLPSLGQAKFTDLRRYYLEAARGLAEGGADAYLVETAQDLLQVKAAVQACHEASDLPVIVHVTVETTGTMLLGSEIGAALAAIEPLGIAMIGLNCATGPAEMSEHLRYLSRHASVPVSVMPNAGLPVLGPNGAEYPLGPDQLARALAGFVREFGLSMVGGCCGTTPEHIAAVRSAINPEERPDARTPVEQGASVASLYAAVPLRQELGITMIGERTNANGSKAFREAMLAWDWERCLDIAKKQTRDGAQLLDVCVDYVGRDGTEDMATLAGLLATNSTLPLMLDSTEPAVVEAGLQQLGGRCVVNSVNFEDPERFERMMDVVVRHGAAVVALAIDEEGQARTAEKKVAVAERLIGAIKAKGLREEDIVVDCLTFPISTGQEETKRDGIETIAAIRELTRRHPRVQTTLGLSNISFGLSPAARQVLNSVFLAECISAGLTSAIAHSSKILPMNRIGDAERELALDLIYDRRPTALAEFMQAFDGVEVGEPEELVSLLLFERLARRIVDGERNGIERDLEEAMGEKDPLAIINEDLLGGMKTVGELFGSGQMQLPFVLQSAETMKTAVSFLEPFMEQENSGSKGTIVLATVKGDVHDIGKNLVDIILSNNGYTVVNLGIKQPIATILSAAAEHDADAVGMSGLLVKSTMVMKENLEYMNEAQARYPVLLGGAALTRGYVEDDLSELYGGDVFYARDAFEGLRLMDGVMHGTASVDEVKRAKRQERKAKTRAARPTPEVPARSDVATDSPLATPPFWGTRVVRGIPLGEYLTTLDERALFMGQWGLTGKQYDELVAKEGRPRLRAWLDELKANHVLDHAAVVYGYFPAVSEGQEIHILESPDPGAQIRARFAFPRQTRGRFLSIPDFIRPGASGEVDVLPLQLVTMGPEIAKFADALFARNAYRDYLEVHGIGVQLTEALAEYWHARVRAEMRLPEGTVADEDGEDFFRLEYRGARYSFGYGSCPDLGSRRTLVELLRPERIGVELSEELQLHPEQSTDAFVLYHPEARYFNV